MSWSRVGFAVRSTPFTPVASLFINVPFSIARHDLVVVGYGTTPVKSGIVVTDNLPGGGSIYSDGGIQDWPDNTASVGYSRTQVPAGSSSFVVTLATPDASVLSWCVAVVVYRHAGSITAESAVAGQGTGTAIGGVPFAVTPTDNVVFMHAAVETALSFPTAVAPLVRIVSGAIGTVGRYAYADAFPVTSALSPAMASAVSADFCYQAGSFSAVVPPPPRFHPSFLGGGTQPAPVYRMQESWGRHWIGPQRRCRFSKLIK